MSRLASMLAVPGGVAAVAGGAGAAGWISAPAATAVGAASLAGVLGAVAVASARPELRVFGPALTRGRHPGRAALTFDDGPHPASTPALLDATARAGATATFFLLADRVARWPELLRAILDGGHEVGLHGRAHHPWLTVWSPARGAADLRAGMETLARHGVPPVRWFRPPFGVTSPRLHDAVRLAGLELAWCSVRTRDGGPISRDTLLARCRAVVGTDVVLLHEGPRLAREVLPEVLAEWDARGIAATTITAALEEP